MPKSKAKVRSSELVDPLDDVDDHKREGSEHRGQRQFVRSVNAAANYLRELMAQNDPQQTGIESMHQLIDNARRTAAYGSGGGGALSADERAVIGDPFPTDERLDIPPHSKPTAAKARKLKFERYKGKVFNRMFSCRFIRTSYPCVVYTDAPNNTIMQALNAGVERMETSFTYATVDASEFNMSQLGAAVGDITNTLVAIHLPAGTRVLVLSGNRFPYQIVLSKDQQYHQLDKFVDVQIGSSKVRVGKVSVSATPFHGCEDPPKGVRREEDNKILSFRSMLQEFYRGSLAKAGTALMPKAEDLFPDVSDASNLRRKQIVGEKAKPLPTPASLPGRRRQRPAHSEVDYDSDDIPNMLDVEGEGHLPGSGQHGYDSDESLAYSELELTEEERKAMLDLEQQDPRHYDSDESLAYSELELTEEEKKAMLDLGQQDPLPESQKHEDGTVWPAQSDPSLQALSPSPIHHREIVAHLDEALQRPDWHDLTKLERDEEATINAIIKQHGSSNAAKTTSRDKKNQKRVLMQALAKNHQIRNGIFQNQ
jgi:hypothetical protein